MWLSDTKSKSGYITTARERDTWFGIQKGSWIHARSGERVLSIKLRKEDLESFEELRVVVGLETKWGPVWIVPKIWYMPKNQHLVPEGEMTLTPTEIAWLDRMNEQEIENIFRVKKIWPTSRVKKHVRLGDGHEAVSGT